MNWLTLFLEFSEFKFFLLAWVLPWNHPHRRHHELPQLCLDTLHEAWPSFTRCSRDLPSILWCSLLFVFEEASGSHFPWENMSSGNEPIKAGEGAGWLWPSLGSLQQSWKTTEESWRTLGQSVWGWRGRWALAVFERCFGKCKRCCGKCKSAWRPSMANCGTGEKANTTVRGKWSCKEMFVVSIFDRLCSFLSETCSHFWIERHRHWVVHFLASSVH